MQRDAGDARDDRHAGGRYAGSFPPVNGVAAHIDCAPQLGATAGRLDGPDGTRDDKRIGLGMAHAAIVQSHCTHLQAHFRTAYTGAVLYPSGMERLILPASDHRAQVGVRLRDALDAIGMQNVEAARIMGVSKQSITEWLAGRGYPNQYGCYRLHRMTGITMDWLFLGDWSALPARLADKLRPFLEGERAASSAAASQAVRTDAAS